MQMKGMQTIYKKINKWKKCKGSSNTIFCILKNVIQLVTIVDDFDRSKITQACYFQTKKLQRDQIINITPFVEEVMVLNATFNNSSAISWQSVVFSGYTGFLHQWNWPPRYNWNIVESGIKHHKPNLLCMKSCLGLKGV